MLPTATEKAIGLLSKNDNGFFLMVEGSQIDWGSHGHNIDYVIEEVIDMDNAVGKALAFAGQDQAIHWLLLPLIMKQGVL